MPSVKNITVDHERLRRHQMELKRALDCMEDSLLFESQFVAGDSMTIADLLVACELAQAVAANYDIGHERPLVAGWFDRVCAQLQPHFDDVGSVLSSKGKNQHGRVYQCESFDMQ